jgi:carbamoyl-phosphate synthase large subunit
MRKTINLLFPCIGRRVPLLKTFRQAAKRVGLRCTVIGTDTTETSPALQCCDKMSIVPPVADARYRPAMLKIIKREKVDLVIPTVDLDLSIWAAYRSRLAKAGCQVLISKPGVVEICQDKRKTHRFLQEKGFDCPKTISVNQALGLKKKSFPYFLKPWDGHASRENVVVHNLEELRFYSKRIKNCLVQEVIEGQEYTADVLVDFDQQVRCIVPRMRIETRSGEVSKSKTVKHSGIMQRCQSLVEKLGAGPGIITIQCFLTSDESIKIIEINPRFGGGIVLSIKAGAHFPAWILKLWLGKAVRISPNTWQDNLTMLRYDESVWCPLL